MAPLGALGVPGQPLPGLVRLRALGQVRLPPAEPLLRASLRRVVELARPPHRGERFAGGVAAAAPLSR
eukprot:13741833-Alexandrium_andersonii.AAC.1